MRRSYLRLTAGYCECDRSAEARNGRAILPDEEAGLLGFLTNDRNYLRPIVVVAVQTGMRKGRLPALEEDLQLDHGERGQLRLWPATLKPLRRSCDKTKSSRNSSGSQVLDLLVAAGGLEPPTLGL